MFSRYTSESWLSACQQKSDPLLAQRIAWVMLLAEMSCLVHDDLNHYLDPNSFLKRECSQADLPTHRG